MLVAWLELSTGAADKASHKAAELLAWLSSDVEMCNVGRERLLCMEGGKDFLEHEDQ